MLIIMLKWRTNIFQNHNEKSQLKFKQIAWGILINSDYPDFILRYSSCQMGQRCLSLNKSLN